MKNIHICLLFFLPVFLFSYEAKAEISAPNRELKVSLQYRIEGDSVTITLPQRARLQVIVGTNQQPIPVYQNGNVLTFSKIQDIGKIIQISYSIPTASEEFFLEEWLPSCSEKGRITVNTISPQGYRFLIFPYERRMNDGYVLDPATKPRLIFGRYSVFDDSYNQRKITVFSHMKLQTELLTLFTMIKSLEGLLIPLQANTIDFITLPAWQGMVSVTSNQMVAIIGNTTPEAFKSAIVSLFFSSLTHAGWRYALSDYYKRLLADDGGLQTDEGVRLHVPSEAYYQTVLKKGFPSPEKMVIDVNAMEKNYALLQFGFFTVPEKRFHEAVRKLLQNPSQQTWDFSPLFEGTNDRENTVIQWAIEKLLPSPSFTPDLSAKYPYVYRNFTEIDIPAKSDGMMLSLPWNGTRIAMLSNTTKEVILDPERKIPQWNYANDLWITPEEKAMWDIILTAAQNHKVLATDTTREILAIQKLLAPPENKWNLAPKTPVYIVISRVYTTYQNRMTVALKEMILTLNENKVSLHAYRLRF
ncbi:MAG: hypothetical protein N2314_07865 [Brevinematales bacterium]|nr:hypothetical protein [Brevinematales bacterium]